MGNQSQPNAGSPDRGAELQAVRQRLGGALDSLPIYIFRQNNQLVYTWVSNTLRTLLKTDILGKTDHDLLPADQAEEMEAAKRRVLETGEPHRMHVSNSIIGQTRWFDLHLALDATGSNPGKGIIGVAVDITDRMKMQKALRESEEKFRALAEESTVGILLLQAGKLRYVNRALAEMYGYAPDELIDQIEYERLIHPDDRERVQRYIDKRLRGEERTMVYRFRGLTKRGKTIHVEAYGTRTEYEGDAAIIGTDRDITARVRLQREILRIQEEERRRIGRDLHDGVGTQLSAVSLLIGVIERDLMDDHPELAAKLQQVRTYVQEADKNAKSISTGLNPVPLEKKGLSAALERLTRMIEAPRSVSCTIDCDRDIPDLPSEVASHLYWIAQEALTNARKYANADELSLELSCSETELSLHVRDNGRGFDPSDNHRGGLGLRTMNHRAELLGGTLTIDSAPGEGTTVTCQLPLD